MVNKWKVQAGNQMLIVGRVKDSVKNRLFLEGSTNQVLDHFSRSRCIFSFLMIIFSLLYFH